MSTIPEDELQKLENDVYKKGYVDREHLMHFLSLIPTNEASVIITEVKGWLKKLHDNPELSKVSFYPGDIDAIIGDLDSYGRVQAQTILEYKRNSSRNLPVS